MKKLIVSLLLGVFCAGAFAQEVKVTYYSPKIVRIQKSADGKFRTKPSVSVTMAPQGKVAKPDVKVSVGADGKVVFTDAKGKVLLSEGASSFKAITEGLDKGAWEVSQSWNLDPDEPIYGLGMLQNGKMSQRGENREMIQSNLEDYQNFFQSVKGYGVFWDNYSPTTIADDGTSLSLSSQVAEDIDYYFIYGGLYNIIGCFFSLIFGILGDYIRFKILFSILAGLSAITSLVYISYFEGEFILFLETILVSLIYNGFNIIFGSHIMNIFGAENYIDIWAYIRAPEGISHLLGIILNCILDTNSPAYKIVYGISSLGSLISLSIGICEGEDKFNYEN